MKIIAGIYQTDSGIIRVGGKQVHFRNVPEALAEGISLIHQELNLAENLSIAANLFLGRETWRASWLPFVDGRRLAAQARSLMDRVGLQCSPGTTVGELAPGQRQQVEI